MKTKICFLFIFCTFLMSSQSLEKLKKETKKIYDANYLMSFDSIAFLTYPKITETLGKNKFLEKLDSDFQNETYRMRLQLVSPAFQYGEFKSISGKTFCVISYRNPVRFFYESKLNTTIALVEANVLRARNQTKDVLYEPQRNSFNVKRISKFIAIIDETTANNWRFFNMDDPIQRQLFDDFFNEGIKKELGF